MLGGELQHKNIGLDARRPILISASDIRFREFLCNSLFRSPVTLLPIVDVATSCQTRYICGVMCLAYPLTRFLFMSSIYTISFLFFLRKTKEEKKTFDWIIWRQHSVCRWSMDHATRSYNLIGSQLKLMSLRGWLLQAGDRDNRMGLRGSCFGQHKRIIDVNQHMYMYAQAKKHIGYTLVQ